jgi:hypothetical protein
MVRFTLPEIQILVYDRYSEDVLNHKNGVIGCGANGSHAHAGLGDPGSPSPASPRVHAEGWKNAWPASVHAGCTRIVQVTNRMPIHGQCIQRA